MGFYKEIERSVYILKNGKSLLYPTDTVWALGCDAFNKQAINNIYKIKYRDLSKTMILLVDNIYRLYELVGDISPFIKKVILYNLKQKTQPITVVYRVKNNKIFRNLIKKNDNTLAVRVTYDPFCIRLIKKLDKPIISTSANLSGFSSPKSFKEINSYIIKNIDYAVNYKRYKQSIYNHSKIIKIFSKKIKILRM